MADLTNILLRLVLASGHGMLRALENQEKILLKLDQIERSQMSQTDELNKLNAGMTNLETDVAAETSAVQILIDELHTLEAQKASTAVDDTETLAGINARMTELDGKIKAAQALAAGAASPDTSTTTATDTTVVTE